TEFRPLIIPAGGRELVSAPLQGLPILVHVGRGPDRNVIKSAVKERESKQAGSGQRSDRRDGAKSPWIDWNRGTDRFERFWGLADIYNALRKHKARAETIARPSKHRIPGA